MKTISIHVSETAYQEFKSLGARMDRSVSEMIREAMALFLEREGRRQKSLLDLPAHNGGDLLRNWTRSELLDEALER